MSSRRPSAASSVSATPTTYRSRSCATAAYPYGEQRPCHWKERTSLIWTIRRLGFLFTMAPTANCWCLLRGVRIRFTFNFDAATQAGGVGQQGPHLGRGAAHEGDHAPGGPGVGEGAEPGRHRPRVAGEDPGRLPWGAPLPPAGQPGLGLA